MRTFPFRIVFLLLGLLTLLCFCAPIPLGLASAALTYDGTCHGFTDGSSACSWWQYAQNEIFFGSLLIFTPSLFLGLGWLVALGFWGARQFQRTGLRR